MTDKKTAVVTGSNSGIGLGIAHSLAAEGHNVVINSYTDSDEDHALAAEIGKEHGNETVYVSADLSKADMSRMLIEKAAEKFGSVDILVNNAGIQHVAPIEEFPVGKWDAIIAINLSSSFHTIRAALPGMKERGFGRIINVASAHGLVASPFKSAYVAAKHGIVGLTKTIALEAAQHGVTVNAVCPGYVLTPLVEGQIPDTAKARGITEEEVKRDVLLAAQPTKEFVTTEQLGALCVFLASDAAASITGTSLPVDGGWTAQ